MIRSTITIRNSLCAVVLSIALMPLSLYADTKTESETGTKPETEQVVVQEQAVAPILEQKNAQLPQDSQATGKQAEDKLAVDKLVRPERTNVDLLQIFTALAGVIALIVIAAWLMRRMGNITGQRNEKMRVVAALSMGARERVVLMQVGEQQLLLGVSPGRINTLHVLDQALDMSSTNHPVTAFQEKFKKIMSRESES